MSKDEDVSESLMELEAPSVNINLGAAFGFVPISLKIPLPKFQNPFSAVRRRRLSLPFKRLEVRLRAWWDARRSIPELASTDLSAFEMEIVNQSDKKIRDLQMALAPQKLDIGKTLNALEPFRINAEEGVRAVKHQCAEWMATLEESLAQTEEWVQRSKAQMESTREALQAFARNAGLPSIVPRKQLMRGDRLAELVVLGVVDLILSIGLVAANPDLGKLHALLICVAFSAMNVLVGLAGGQFVAHFYFRDAHGPHRALQSTLLWTWVAAGVLLNVMFGAVRNHNVAVFDPMGVALVIVGLALFGWFGVIGFRDFADVHPGHWDRWRDYVTSRNVWNDARRARTRMMMRVREGRAEVHKGVRDEMRQYEEAIQGARCAAADCQASLEAVNGLIPSLIREYSDTAVTLVTLYRECARHWRRRWNEAPEQAAAPDLQFASLPFDLAAERVHVARIVSILDANREELRRFREQFEDYVKSVIERPDGEDSGGDSVGDGRPPQPGGDGPTVRTTTGANGTATVWPSDS